MLAIVTGMIGTYPVGGVAWDYGQYAVGLERLGFDVYYLEDTGGPTYDPHRREYGDDCSFGIRFLEQSLSQLSPALASRWHFRAANGDCFGTPRAEIKSLAARADLLLNVSGGTLLRDEYMPCRRKVLVDTDPGWNHFVNYPRWDANPGWQNTHGYRGHDFHFTYAERMGVPDCLLPNMGLTWHPTRPPVLLDQWSPRSPAERWTTVMTWNNFHTPVEYNGARFGTKEVEFAKIVAIPRKLLSRSFELAAGGSGAPIEDWRRNGWNVLDSYSVSATMDDYRNYVQQSRAELSVAKNLYTATKSGWFSCRSACYLAAGRPAVIQDTGFSDILPTGQGLFAFTHEEEALSAIDAVESDYERHSRAARDFAVEYLDASKVIGNMLDKVGLH